MDSITVAKALYYTLNMPEMIEVDNPDYPGQGEPEKIEIVNPDYAGSLASLEIDVNVVTGVGKRNANYPCVTIFPVDDVPRIYHRGDPSTSCTPTSQTTWDLKIWGKSIEEVSKIYDRIVESLESDIILMHNCEGEPELVDDGAASFRGRGMPLMAEDNRPNEIIYSRVIECEVIF